MIPFRGKIGSLGVEPTFVDSQVGNAGDKIVQPYTRNVQAGDLMLFISADSPPTEGWSNAGNARYKIASQPELNTQKAPNKPWALLVYRGPQTAVPVISSGFKKSSNHLGVVAIFEEMKAVSPAAMVLKYSQINPPTQYGYDMTAPNPLYVDDTAFMPNRVSVYELRG